ncbi:DUF6053 domain-containing protein [Lysobacter enzymogenes]
MGGPSGPMLLARFAAHRYHVRFPPTSVPP